MKKEKINKFSLERFLSYNIHCGSLQMDRNPMSKPYIQGFRNDFCILDLSQTQLYLRYSLRFLKRLLANQKKILFIGSPKGLEKEFSLLCSEKNHFWIGNWSHGSFTNLQSSFSSKNKSSLKVIKRPSLIFFFDLSLYKEAKEEALRLEIPLMAFVNTDESLETIDYPIPANIKSWKGGLFAYNLFFHLLSFYKKN